MAEDSFMATAAGKFRGSRYPGFTSSGAQLDPATGVGISTGSLGGADTSGTAGRNSNSLMSQSFDTPTVEQPSLAGMAKGMGGTAASAAAQYAGTKIGENAGAAFATSSGLGEAITTGASNFAKDVGGMVGLGEGVKGVYTSASEVGPHLYEAGASLGSQSLSTGAGEAASQTSNAATSGSTLGGAAGVGISRTVVGLATGEKPAAALRAGAGAAAGYYGGMVIGTAVGGPVGGMVGSFIGSTIGSIFCFAAGTPIMMADGTWRPVETLDFGDAVALGGKVTGCGKVLAEDPRRYKGTIVESGHAVFEADQSVPWRRVGQSEHAESFQAPDDFLVFPVATENMLLVTPSFIAADVNEVSDPAVQTDGERLRILNEDAARNSILGAFSWFASEGPQRPLRVAVAGIVMRFVDGGDAHAEFPTVPLGDLLTLLGAGASRYAQVAQFLAAIDGATRAEVDGEQVSLIPCAVVLEAICEAAAVGLVGEDVVRQFDDGAVRACHGIALRLGAPFGTFMAEAGRAERERLQPGAEVRGGCHGLA